ncbi:hypothetical protein NMY22_g1458 [Coprinellus aureogranulatus]|nr:hypothetical protein NMY22_g1458 [Coprinellus aureogranulatus]
MAPSTIPTGLNYSQYHSNAVRSRSPSSGFGNSNPGVALAHLTTSRRRYSSGFALVHDSESSQAQIASIPWYTFSKRRRRRRRQDYEIIKVSMIQLNERTRLTDLSDATLVVHRAREPSRLSLECQRVPLHRRTLRRHSILCTKLTALKSPHDKVSTETSIHSFKTDLFPSWEDYDTRSPLPLRAVMTVEAGPMCVHRYGVEQLALRTLRIGFASGSSRRTKARLYNETCRTLEVKNLGFIERNCIFDRGKYSSIQRCTNDTHLIPPPNFNPTPKPPLLSSDEPHPVHRTSTLVLAHSIHPCTLPAPTHSPSPLPLPAPALLRAIPTSW